VGRTAAKLSLLPALFLCPALISQTPGSVQGIVVDSKTGAPLQGVSVYFGTDKGPHYETETDPAGQFRIAGMANGDYGCHFEKSGYISRYSGTENSPLKPVHVAAGQDPVRLTVSLSTYAKLRGRVLDPEGKPVANAKVVLAPLEETTDDPEPIVVHGGDDLFGIEIRLQSLPVYRVRGKAFNLDGKPVRAGSITSFSQEDLAVAASIFGGKTGGGGLLGYFTLSRSALPPPADQPGGIVRDGYFELTSVPRGLRQFRVTSMAVDLDQLREQVEQARKQSFALAAGEIQVLTVSVVVDHDIDDLEIRAEPAITIEATVGLADTTPDNTPAAVRNASVRINGLDKLAGYGKRTGNSFHFENVTPGEGWVDAPPGLVGGYYLSSVSLGGQDITWKSVNLQAGSPPISVIYKPNAGTVAGTVESADAGSVVLIPQAGLDAADVQYGRITPLGPGGAFEIDSLAPGSYYAFAVDRLQPERLYNRALLGRIAAAAALVRVTEGATVSIKPPLVDFEN
jgi:hypothetical protein